MKELTTEATRPIPAGKHQVRVEFAYAGGGLGASLRTRRRSRADLRPHSLHDAPVGLRYSRLIMPMASVSRST